jgi:hypothetical protein
MVGVILYAMVQYLSVLLYLQLLFAMLRIHINWIRIRLRN